jgi:hypothetical protein
MKKQILALLLGLVLIPFVALAQEKKGTVDSYDEGSRMVVIKGKDWEQKAKVSSSVAKEKADLLKAGTKVTVDFDDRGGGDVRVKALSGR